MKKKIIKITNGVNLETFKNKKIYIKKEVSKINLISIGRLEKVKNHLYLIKVIKTLINFNSNIKLTLIGCGQLYQSLMNYIESNYLNEFVEINSESHLIPQKLRNSDIYVQSSLFEGISNSILEAMASGLPIIATKVGGNTELVTDNYNGLLVAPNDEENLSRAILQYLQNPKLRVTHGIKSRARVEKLFSLKGMINSYDKTYSKGFK